MTWFSHLCASECIGRELTKHMDGHLLRAGLAFLNHRSVLRLSGKDHVFINSGEHLIRVDLEQVLQAITGRHAGITPTNRAEKIFMDTLQELPEYIDIQERLLCMHYHLRGTMSSWPTHLTKAHTQLYTRMLRAHVERMPSNKPMCEIVHVPHSIGSGSH